MDISEIVQQQRAFFSTGQTRPVSFRIDSLKKLKQAVAAHEADILSALRSDLNKPHFEGYMTEIGMVLDELSFMLSHVKKWARSRRVKTPLHEFYSKSFVSPEPYGVVLVMAPWNYPFQLAIEPLIGALAAGNTCILKPSAYAPRTSSAVRCLLMSVFPPEYVAVVEGGRAENTALLEQKFDYIFFTGSVGVGKLVMEAAARHLTPVSLELGGKSPCIVDASANLAIAAKRLAFGKFLNAGQTCVAPDYLLVQDTVQDELLALLKRETSRFFEAGFDDFPTIVNEKHYERIMRLIEPERVFFGGSGDPSRRFIEPTVLVNVEADAPVMREEIFGPVLPVLTWHTPDEAIDFIASRPKPLALYLFTSDKAVERAVLNSCSFGGGCINDTIIHLATSRMGFGGVGESGMGSYHGKSSFDTFTHYRSIVKKSCRIDLPMRYRPYTDRAFSILRRVMK